MKKFVKILVTCLFVIATLFCVACGTGVPSTAERAKTKMEKLGYRVYVTELSEEEFGSVGIKSELRCIDFQEGTAMTGYLFKSKATAKDYYENKKQSNEMEGVEMKMTQIGKWVLLGDYKARKDFKS